MKRTKNYNTMLFIVFFSVLVACDNSGVKMIKSDYCCEEFGCLNTQFIKKFEEKCKDKNNGCLFSFEEFFGDLDKIYFIEKMSIRFNECKEIPIPRGFKKSNAGLCQYILFEKDKELRGYLRGFCLSDVKLPKNEVGFSPDKVDLVSVMNANEAVLIQKIDEGNKNYYYIEPQRSQLTRYNEDCVGQP